MATNTTTPLLSLLDGVLSRDEEQIRQAMQHLHSAAIPTSEVRRLNVSTLVNIVASIVARKPEWASVASQRDGSLPLHFAASIGNIEVARLILQHNRQATSVPNHKGKIPLHYAAREGRTEMVEYLLQEAPETAAIRSKKDKLALHFAAGEGHLGVVQALLNTFPVGASIRSKKGKVAIHFAARWGHISVAKALLAVSPQSIQVADYEGSSALHDAAREGQYEMMRYLVTLFPKGLEQENVRGETPLFPAVRTRNLELVKFMVRAWPKGGQHVLQRVCQEDDVAEWPPQILDLCLRGAVDIWEEEQHALVSKDTVVARDYETPPSSPLSSARSSPVKKVSWSLDGNAIASRNDNELDIHFPRSKSPVLLDSGDAHGRSKKRSFKAELFNPKRARIDSQIKEWVATSEHRSFYELHAALQCGAAAPVLDCILDRFGESQLQALDELGRTPLHVAMGARCSHVSIIIERILNKFPKACFIRDFLGRLPLHLALMSRVDTQLIKALLDTNSGAGVEYCDVVDDEFIDKLPLEMAMSSGCDLSAIYMLVRADPSIVRLWL